MPENILQPMYNNEDEICGIISGDIPYYFVKNLQGDVIAITDHNGETVARYSYDAWGACTITLDTEGIGSANPFRYRGYYYDTETNLYYLQSRYYDASVGRFVNGDEVNYLGASSDIIGVNLFAYCCDDAINYLDKNGYARYTTFKKIGSHRRAIEYAKKWWNGRNPQFTFNRNSQDCANFVSQCIYAAGMPMNSYWHYYRVKFGSWYFKVDISNKWGKAPMLHDLLKQSAKSLSCKVFNNYKIISNCVDFQLAINSKKYSEGSIAFIHNSSGVVYHAVFIGKSTRNNIFYWAHTNNRDGYNTFSNAGLRQVIETGKKVALISANYNQEMRF